MRFVPAGITLLLAALLPFWRWNPAGLILLDDHPVRDVVWWPAMCLLLGATVVFLTPPARRTAVLAPVAVVTVLLLAVGAVPVWIVTPEQSGAPAARDAAGRYEVRIQEWHAVLGETGWDVTIRRNDGYTFTDADAGCIYQEPAFERVASVTAGTATLITSDGPLTITFDPDTMQVSNPIEHCAGFD
ncbi:MAG TPA: hypothetical protein VN408_35390 [Actinoplanes sp.]|nr:hypothetical protein [Actinoplanes sp.]